MTHYTASGTITNVTGLECSLIVVLSTMTWVIPIQLAGVSIFTSAQVQSIITSYLSYYPAQLANGTCTVINNGASWNIVVNVDYIGNSNVMIPLQLLENATGGVDTFLNTAYFIPLTSCASCYQINAFACQDTYTFALGLTPATWYAIKIIADKSNYLQLVLSNGAGSLIMNALSFPNGFWTVQNMPITVEVYADSGLTILQPFTIGTSTYTCIEVNLKNLIIT
jgi:hypothetical protein